MNPKSKTKYGLALAVIFAVCANIHAAPVIHEPFADSHSSLTGNTPGTGLSGTWSASASVVAGSLNYGSLALGSGNKVSTSNTYGGVSVDGTTLSAAGLLDDGAALWFSALIQTGGDVGVNGDLGFALGTDRISSGNNIPVQNNGQALGVRFKNNQMRAAHWVPGNILQSTGSSAANSTQFLVVGRFLWGSSSDTIEIYNVATDLTPTLSSTYTTTSNVNQSVFDTVSFGNKSATPAHFIDEIRFGATYADVTPNPGDATDPTLASTVPLNTGTDADGILQATFDEPIRVGTGDIRIYSGTAPGTLLTTITVPSSQVSVVGTSTLQIVPTTPYAPSTQYYVEMDSGVVEDSNSNPFAGFTGDSTWSFTTGNTAPTVVSVTSEYNSADIFVGLTNEIHTVTFDKPMDGSSIDASDFGGAGTDTGSVTIGTITQLNPYTFTVAVIPATPGTYTFTVFSANTVSDLTGNALSADYNHATKDIQTSAQSATITAATAVLNDTWQVAANWDGGFVPDKQWGAIVAAEVAAISDKQETPAYSGGLVIQNDASLRIGGQGSSNLRPDALNALGTTTITMNSGSSILWQHQSDPKLLPITLNGDASVIMTSNESHNSTYEFDAISGTGSLTVKGTNNNVFEFQNDSSSWSGGLVTANADTNNDTLVKAKAANCLGTGNVTVESYSSLQLDVDSTIGDAATLALTGAPNVNGSTNKLILNNPNPEVVGLLSVDGLPRPAGTYGRTGLGGVDFEVSWISGNGILDVAGESNPGSLTVDFAGVGEGGSTTYAYETEPVIYTITFSAEHSPALTAADLETTSGIGFTIESFVALSNPLANPTQYRVVVKATEPGFLNLRIKNTTVITDDFGNVLTVPAPDNDTLTIDALPGFTGSGGWKPWWNDRINPGTGLAWAADDTYHIAFVTSGTRDATDPDISTYNTFVSDAATTAGITGVTWYCIGQSFNNPTRDTNAPPMTSSSVIMLLNGTKLADNGADLSNGPDVFFNITETETEWNGNVATGSNRKFGDPGQAVIEHGNSNRTDAGWWQVFNGAKTSQWHFYAISNTLTLQTASGGSPFETWADGFLPDDVSNPADDNDNDGFSNLLEFAFGTDPTVSDAGSLTWDGTNFTPGSPVVNVEYPIEGGVDFTARFIRRTDHGDSGSAAYAWQFSSDLSDWEASDDAPAPGWLEAPTVLDTEGDYQLVEVPYPFFLDSGKKASFFRVGATLVP